MDTSITPEYKKKEYINDVYFVNDKDEKVYVHCDYKLIINELTKLGIYSSDATIDGLIEKLNPLLESKFNAIVKDKNYLEEIRSYNEFHNKIRVLYLSMLDVSFYLYDYKESKMPCKLKKVFTSKYI
jgi:hypothetical protein